MQALPGVAGGDDFLSEYSVRASPYRHAAVVVDGVVAPWLQHAALERGDSGTLTMLPGAVLENAELHVGAYARRESSQLGPQLNLTLREGSRTARRFRLGVSGTSTTMTAEGPLGFSERGSWLVGARKSHVEWPVGRNDHQSTVFGFADVQSKLVYDVGPRQQVSLSVVAGVSNIERDDPNPFALADGHNRSALVSVAWRSLVGARTIVTQRASTIAHTFVNQDQAMRAAGRGADGANAYRVDVTRTLFGGVLEAGGQVRRLYGSRRGPAWGAAGTMESADAGDIEASWAERAAHVSFRQAIGPGMTLGGGLRVADSSLVRRRAVDRWLHAEWSVGPRWRVRGSTGVMHQFAALEEVRGWSGVFPLRPERARYVDLGIGQRLTTSVRWDATIFSRWEHDALRARDVHPRLIDGVFISADSAARSENALSALARGIELSVERRSRRLSGWAGYSYGVARATDVLRQETFDADFDQRHAFNVSGLATLAWKTRVGLTFRSGTNFPIPGYLLARDGGLFAGDRRNQARLPAYARLDLRAERSFDSARPRFTLFAEAWNVLNHLNIGLADGAVRRDTGEAIGFTERLFPRLMTAGIRFEF